MSKQELSNKKMTWDELEEKIKKSREGTENIDQTKTILNKMSVTSGGRPFFDDVTKDESKLRR